MHIYGPSAHTGLAAGVGAGGIAVLTGNPVLDGVYIGLAAFTVLGGIAALVRSLPKRRSQRINS